MTTSEQINEIATACAKAQAELKPAVKDATNPAFKSKYADLAAITEASRAYARYGVAIFQEATTVEAGASVATRIAHTSGQWIQFEPLVVPLAKRDAHGTGSGLTYAKRYALQAALNIPSDDDDGNAAAQPHVKQAVPVPVLVPDGFDHWLADLEAVADEGTDRLQIAWKQSQPYLRKHLTDTNKDKWDALKARAELVGTGKARPKTEASA